MLLGTLRHIDRVPTAQGKWPKKIPVRENTVYLEILPKHREFGLLKNLILKVKDILKFLLKNSFFSPILYGVEVFHLMLMVWKLGSGNFIFILKFAAKFSIYF